MKVSVKVRGRVSREQVALKRHGLGEPPRELGADFTLLELSRRSAAVKLGAPGKLLAILSDPHHFETTLSRSRSRRIHLRGKTFHLILQAC